MSSQIDSLSNFVCSVLEFAISSMILASVMSIFDYTISNNYLIRFGTKASQEKSRKLTQHKLLIQKTKTFNYIRHYKRFQRLPIIMRVKE